MQRRDHWFYLILIILSATGCSGWRDIKQTRAIENMTPVTQNLTMIPPPKRKIGVTVYKSKDMSGQYKYHPAATSFSTAVTQGSTPMLIKAAIDSGWFAVAEREGLGNLLTEQKILKQKLALMGKNANVEQNLMLPEYVIEGGITEFNENIVTGGFGVKYFGIGPNTKVSIAAVVIDIRLVKVITGMVVDTVSVAKRVLSYEIDFGVFAYVATNRLLEVETGVTNNEPVQMAVREAIETAVTLLIARGVKQGLWEPARQEDVPIFEKLLVTEAPPINLYPDAPKPFWEVIWPKTQESVPQPDVKKDSTIRNLNPDAPKPFSEAVLPKEQGSASQPEAKKDSPENNLSPDKSKTYWKEVWSATQERTPEVETLEDFTRKNLLSR